MKMNFMIHASLAGILALMLSAAPAEAQNGRVEDLQRVVDQLQKRIVELEKQEARLDIRETPSAYTITFDLRGFKEKVDIDIHPASLTVKSEYSWQETGQDPGARLQTREYGSFARTIPIPDDADVSRIRTEKQNERLIITLPKRNQIPDVQESRENQRLRKFQRIAYFQV